jgi:hypothetical protein
MGGLCTSDVKVLPDPKEVLKDTQIPEWVSTGGQKLFQQAAELGASPFPEFTGDRIATYGDISAPGETSKFTEREQKGLSLLDTQGDIYKPYLERAGEVAKDIGSQRLESREFYPESFGGGGYLPPWNDPRIYAQQQPGPSRYDRPMPVNVRGGAGGPPNIYPDGSLRNEKLHLLQQPTYDPFEGFTGPKTPAEAGQAGRGAGQFLTPEFKQYLQDSGYSIDETPTTYDAGTIIYNPQGQQVSMEDWGSQGISPSDPRGELREDMGGPMAQGGLQAPPGPPQGVAPLPGPPGGYGDFPRPPGVQPSPPPSPSPVGGAPTYEMHQSWSPEQQADWDRYGEFGALDRPGLTPGKPTGQSPPRDPETGKILPGWLDPIRPSFPDNYAGMYQEAIEPALQDVSETFARQRRDLGAAAGRTGAFGDRAGLESAELARGEARERGRLRQEAGAKGLEFSSAQFERDRAARERAFEMNRASRERQFDLEQSSRRMEMEAQERLAPAAQGLIQQQAQGLIGAGEAQRALDQQALEMAYRDYVEQREYPFTALNFAMGALKGMPYDTREYSMQRGGQFIQSPSVYGQTMGGLGALASAYKLLS